MRVPGLGRFRAALAGSTATTAPRPQRPGEGRFERRAPSPQNVVDLWAGNWASDLSGLLGVTGTGKAGLFEQDERPAQAAERLGAGGRLDGMSVLELGPLEGGHSWMLERLGARSILAVEASAEAYLKCLAVKELLPLERTRFLHGDAIGFLEDTAERFDLVFCSGILYHMSDPLRLIAAIARVTDRCFVWTHYRDAVHPAAPSLPRPLQHRGFEATGWVLDYGTKQAGFWGGNAPTTCWLERKDILRAFSHFGLGIADVVAEQPDHPHGPAFTFAVRRQGPG